MKGDISVSIPRVDAADKVTGRAVYLDDISIDGLFYGRFVRSSIARGVVESIRVPELPEAYTFVDYKDIRGENAIALIKKDWPAIVEKEVRFIGEILGLLVGPDRRVLDDLLKEFHVEYKEQEACYSIEEALNVKGGPIVGNDNVLVGYELERGDVDAAFNRATRVVEGTYKTGFQEHVYLETQSIEAWLDGEILNVRGSMQCPYYVKHAVETVVGHDINVRIIQTLTGGGFGGKEDYPEIIGGALATAVLKTGKHIRIVYDRSEDLAFTTKRHPSLIHVKTAHDEKGNILAMDMDVLLNGGAYETYSAIVLQRSLFTSNGVYNFPAARVRGRAMATNTVPSGAFRGFGAPQAIFALESHMNHAACEFGLEALDLKKHYFLKEGDPTITQGKIRESVKLPQMLARIEKMSQYSQKRLQYGKKPWFGIGLSVFNHGCGFTGDGEQRIIKAKVQLKKHADDNVEILVANVDMGQGLFTTYRKIVAQVLDIKPEEIIYNDPDTAHVPDSGPTVASRSIMVVGKLLEQASQELKAEWKTGEEQLIECNYAMPEGMSWDQEKLRGDAYPVFGWAINVVEVKVDPDTYEVEVLGSWAVFDVGKAIDRKVVEGQIQGGMIQALGYGALEKLDIHEGMFYQRTLADYIIPTSLDFPRTQSDLVDNPFAGGPFGAKGIGEIVHDGAHAAFTHAVEQAINRNVSEIPLTPEKILEVLHNEN